MESKRCAKIVRLFKETYQYAKEVKSSEHLKKLALKAIENLRGSTEWNWIVYPTNYWEIHDDIVDGMYLGFPVRCSVDAKQGWLSLLKTETADKRYPLEEKNDKRRM